MAEKVNLQPEGYDNGADGAGDADVSSAMEMPSSIIDGQSRIVRHAQIANVDGYPLVSSRRGVDNRAEDSIEIYHDVASEFSFLFDRRLEVQRLDDLHPFVQLLSLSNVDDCVSVEAAFPEHERSTREKLIYRLTKCPELSLGLFTIPPRGSDKYEPRASLVAHIIATRTSAPCVTDASMAYPLDWRSKHISIAECDEESLGHQDQGSTIAVHSFAVRPEHQNKKVGTTLILAYIQRIRSAAIANRIALLAHESLIPFYQRFGFKNQGPSNCEFGGGGWFDLVSIVGSVKGCVY